MEKICVIIKSCSTSTKSVVKGDRKSFLCYKCNQKFTERQTFIEHWLEHMEVLLIKLGTSPPKRTREFECEHCKNEFHSMLHLEKHLTEECSKKNCDSYRKYSVCSKQFSCDEELEKHKALDHKQYACTLCDKCYNSKSDLMKHLLIHSDLRPFKCPQCDSSFKSKSALNKHLVTHSSNRPHVCSQCNAKFRLKQHLHLHFLTHNGLRRFQCGDCGDKFKQSAHLRTHMLSKHSNEKPYLCKLCGRAFKVKQNLSIHQLTHLDDKDKPHKCHICTFTSCQKPKLRTHLRKKHGVL